MVWLARTNAEAHLFMDLRPCGCGVSRFERKSSVVMVEGDLASRYTGRCEGCGIERVFEFRIPEEILPPPTTGVRFGGMEPSQLLDPGEWLAVATDHAKRIPARKPLDDNARHGLAVAIAALNEVVKFIPSGEQEVPPEAFRTPVGRELREREPGRFRTVRLRAVRDAYTRLLEPAEELLARGPRLETADPVQILNDYAREPSREKASLDRVVRALVEHDDWYVPIMLPGAAPAPGGVVEKVITFADPAPLPGGLHVFTSRESALCAVGKPLGPYRGGIAGTTLFTHLDPAWGDCTINGFSPTADQWFVGIGAFSWMKLFAEAITVERALIAGESFDSSAVLRDYDGYMVALARSDNTAVEQSLQNGGRACFVFTARDHQRGWLDGLLPGQAAAIGFAELDGARLTALMRSAQHLSSVIVNADAPAHQMVISRARLGLP
jgi:hypothetical protein